MSSDPILPPDSTPSPIPPTGEPGTPLVADSALTTSLGMAPNVEAGLSVVLTWLTGLIFFVLEKRNAFVRFWAMQSIYFGVAWIIEGIVAAIIGMILAHIPVIQTLWSLASRLVSLGFVVVWIMMMIKAFTGKTWEIPVLGKMARDQVGKTPFV